MIPAPDADAAEAERRQRVVSDITTLLLDYTGTDEIEPLRRVGDLIVAGFGDWCSISLIDDAGLLQPVFAHHPDPHQRELVEELRKLLPPQRWDAGLPEFNALLKGAPIVIEKIEPEMLRKAIPDEKTFQLFTKLGLTSSITVPLRSGQTPLGTLGLVSAGPGGRRYTQADLDFVTAISSRLSMAIRNARLAKEVAGQRDELLAVMDASPAGIVLFDANDKLKYMSPRVDQIFGSSNRHLVGLHYLQLPAFDPAVAHDARMRNMAERFREAFSDRDSDLTDDIELPGPGNRVVRRVAIPVRSANGDYIGRLFLFTDITEDRKLVRERNEFLTIAAHELRTPLTPLAMHFDLIRRRIAAGAAIEPSLLTRGEKQVKRLADLIDDLLNMSRLEAGRLEFHPQPLRLDTFIGDLVAQYHLSNQTHTVAFRDPGRAIRVDADPARLEQVIVNLLQNATKYSPQGGRVVVEVTSNDTEAIVSVTDDGIGIPKAEQAHLFERYFRAQNATSSNFGGLGIGLYLSNEIVRRHGGRFEVVSDLDQGSTFTFRLPLGDGALSSPSSRRVRVLLVEDDPSILETVTQLLEEEGYDVQQARNGLLGLERLRKASPDIILLDLMMPLLSGEAFVEKMRAEGLATNVPLVVFSADRDAERKGAALGAVASLRKPLAVDLLLDTLRAHVVRRPPATA